ncbi:MAG TPA: ABC transporter ATP-binding protein [Deltaproteobacteria bacterium]|nr:ABC transporter ATP-binding protein [Deltaproteobacteria bacterium]
MAEEVVKVEGLVKRYGDFVAVDGVSFGVSEGEVFALLGPNGSGKTTILRTMVGLLTPDSGTILVKGVDVRRKPVEARALIGYVPQRPSFPENLTGAEVLRFYANLRGADTREVEEAAQRMGLGEAIDRPTGEYSGGMVQRLAVAVALLGRPEVLVLDEPTVNLDPEGVVQFREALRAMKEEGKAILVATHLLAEAEALADRVAIIDKGHLLFVGPMEEIKERVLRAFRCYVSFGEFRDDFLKVAKENGALEVVHEDSKLVFSTASIEDRLRVINALAKAGARIERFGTLEPPLEEVYMQVLKGEKVQ